MMRPDWCILAARVELDRPRPRGGFFGYNRLLSASDLHQLRSECVNKRQITTLNLSIKTMAGNIKESLGFEAVCESTAGVFSISFRTRAESSRGVGLSQKGDRGIWIV